MVDKAIPFLAAVCVICASCSMTNRLTFVRPNADRGKVTQVSPRYDVSGAGRSHKVAVPTLLAIAHEHYRAGRLIEAQATVARALKRDPSSADANTMMGLVSIALGQASKAGDYYLKAVTLAPATGAYANNYGTWLCGNGRAAESLAWFEKAVADPNYPTRAVALANAGTCANRAGQPVQAEANWRQALALDPGELQSLAGMAGLQFARGRHLEARAFAERWLALAPSDAEGLHLASQIELKLGDTAASARYLHRLQALSPGAANVPRTQ